MQQPPERNILLGHKIFMASYFARKHCLPWSATKQSMPARICLCESNYVPHRSGAATRGAALGRAPPGRYRCVAPAQESSFWKKPKRVQEEVGRIRHCEVTSQEIPVPVAASLRTSKGRPRRDRPPQHRHRPDPAPSQPRSPPLAHARTDTSITTHLRMTPPQPPPASFPSQLGCWSIN